MDNPEQEGPVIIIIKPPKYMGKLVFSEAEQMYIPEAEIDKISEVKPT